jgi:hypothetical protein
MGPITAWQRAMGTVFSAGAGTFNLATGAFTRTGAAVNQIAIYGVDSMLTAMLRTGAAAEDLVSPR